MEFRLLGPLEVWHDGREVPVRGTKQRALLAVLLLHANQAVSADRLLDQLWGDEPPEAGTAALRVRISQLRKALSIGGSIPIVTRPGGYAVELAAEQLDLHRFERLVAEAGESEPARATQKLRQALALWRGPALADFVYEPFAYAPAARLEELRILATQRRVEADLALRRHAELVPELELLVTQHPLREQLRAQLILALYRSGRQADALAAYQAARRTLVEELGIEPGLSLQKLERAILRQDDALQLPPAEAAVRSILAVGLRGRPLEPVLSVAGPLAREPNRELIVARLLDDRASLAGAAAEVGDLCAAAQADGVVSRAAVFTSDTPGADAARLATEQDVDLVLVSAGPELLDECDLRDILARAPCDVAVQLGSAAEAGPVLVLFAGSEHDWGAIEVAAWLARGLEVPLRLAGPALEGGGDASRLLASASLAVQRALGVAAEPLLVEPGAEGLVTAAQSAAIAVVGLSERWRDEGVGEARGALARSGRPVLLVRKGLRPGGLAAPSNLTRFTWSLAR
jgi:DNA-binding SARP family transcriptional activator